MFSRAESLEDEESIMKELSRELASITRGDGPEKLKVARQLISTLHDMNMRWNMESLNIFLVNKSKELFFRDT